MLRGTGPQLRIGFRSMVAALVSMPLMTACSTNADNEEIAAVSAAAASFRTEATARSPIRAADAASADAVALERLALGGQVKLNIDCEVFAMKAEQAFATSTDAASEDDAFQALKEAEPCGFSSPRAPGTGHPELARTTSAIKAFSDYFQGLDDIVNAGDTTGILAAMKRVDVSVTALAAAANAPAPLPSAPGFIDKLAQTAFAAAQYRALRHVVLTVDSLLNPARPAITTALRERRARLIASIAADAAVAGAAAQGLLNNPKLAGEPTRRLAYYDRMRPILADLAEKQAAAQKDPKENVDELFDAHHKLASALRSNKGQAASIISAAADIADGAQALLPPKKP